MKYFRKVILSFGLAIGILGSTGAHAGIPVIDGANLVQSIQQVIAWSNQYAQMVNQYSQLTNQLNSVTGIRNLGDILNNPLLQDVVPGDVATVYNTVKSGGFANLTTAAKTLRSAAMVYNCEDRTGDAKSVCEAALNLNAQTQALQESAMTLVNQRVAQIQSLQSQINATSDPKAIAELQARIQAENTQVGNDANRLAVMQAMAAAKQAAAEQAIKERGLRMLASTTPTASSSFVYVPPVP